MGEAATALLTIGQQVLQQQQSGEQPGVCFAMVPLLIPATMIFAHAITKRVRRLAARAA
ncbi:MAG: hypothetical protein AB7P40_06870 [Chloroflexota bacterium]